MKLLVLIIIYIYYYLVKDIYVFKNSLNVIIKESYCMIFLEWEKGIREC